MSQTHECQHKNVKLYIDEHREPKIRGFICIDCGICINKCKSRILKWKLILKWKIQNLINYLHYI